MPKYRVVTPKGASFTVAGSDYSFEREALDPIGAEIVEAPANEAEFIAAAKNADAIYAKGMPISKAVIDALENCKVISLGSVGVLLGVTDGCWTSSPSAEGPWLGQWPTPPPCAPCAAPLGLPSPGSFAVSSASPEPVASAVAPAPVVSSAVPGPPAAPPRPPSLPVSPESLDSSASAGDGELSGELGSDVLGVVT